MFCSSRRYGFCASTMGEDARYWEMGKPNSRLNRYAHCIGDLVAMSKNQTYALAIIAALFLAAFMGLI